ncbi:serine palmitoyltransferase component [Elasticomyces elasticus]|nr:serine palmitoyltransferase component [Elasticomyces elasticus]KAK4990848.1 serine palmitoyltransferase component [Elasticomyces elasticus]
MNGTFDFGEAQNTALHYVSLAAAQVQRVPGSAIALRYIKSSYQNDPVRSAVELFLFLFAVRYLLAPTYSTLKSAHVPLTEDEIDELVEDWTPEPLVAIQTTFEEAENEKRPVIVGPTGPKSRLSTGRTVTNLATQNHYNFLSSAVLKDRAISTLRTYGVGPCGPPGFYGTQDVHMKLEADIASHLGTAACIIYAQSFSASSSVIPAFSKRGDIIVADRAVNYAIRKGLQISRSSVRWYNHNDMADLERVLATTVKEQARKPLTRRFIITEGISETCGDILDLPALVALKHRYKFRLIIDECLSYGVLGRTGRGITEHTNVDATNIDMIIGSLSGALCAGGGFCAGSEDIVEHQRLAAPSYTFSAALPAMLATAASETIRLLQEQPDLFVQLRENIKTMRAQLDPRSDWVMCTSAPENPIMLLVFKPEVVESRKLGVQDQEGLLQDVVDECLANNVLITRLKSLPEGPADAWQPQPAVKVCITTGLSKRETEKAGIVIRHAITKVMTRKKAQST